MIFSQFKLLAFVAITFLQKKKDLKNSRAFWIP